MSPYTFAGWLVVALGTLVAAIVVNLGQAGPASVRLENEVAFEDLRSEPDLVTRVAIQAGGKSFSLERRDDGTWVSPEKDGYPIDARHIRALIVGMSDMRLVEAKTTREDRFARLEVEDSAVEGAKSRLVRLETAEGGEPLVEIIVGKTRGRFTGGVEGGTYIRRPGEQQAWLASGRIEVKSKLHDWLQTDIMHLPSDSIARVEMAALGEQPGFVLARPDADGDYSLEGLPEGQVVEPSQASRVASGLSFLSFDDVAPRARFALPAERRRGVFTTRDGVEVTVQMAPIEDESWALFSARFVAPEGQSEEAAAAARRQAEEIAALVEGWLYKLPDHVVKRFEIPLESLHRSAGGTS